MSLLGEAHLLRLDLAEVFVSLQFFTFVDNLFDLFLDVLVDELEILGLDGGIDAEESELAVTVSSQAVNLFLLPDFT